MRRIGHKETCEDIVSDVFRKVFLNLHTYDPVKASFRVWIFRITTNTMTDHYRVHRNPDKPINVDIEEALDVHDESVQPHEDLMRSEDNAVVRECIAQLPERYQQVLQLKYFDDLPHEEIAQILEIKPNNVGVLVHRAIAKLEPLLQKTATI